MSGHTPGPLQLVEGYEVWDTRGDGEPGIPLIRADLGLNRKWGRDIGGSEIVANLSLFAAAPELLAVVESLDALWCEDFEPPHPDVLQQEPRLLASETLNLWRAARAAIAKARNTGAQS